MKTLILFCIALVACGSPKSGGLSEDEPVVAPKGPFLGESEPGNSPKLFSPNFISTGLNEREPSLAPDGKTFYYWIILPGSTVIMVSQLQAQGWTAPQVAPFSGTYSDFEPCFSADGQKLFFSSDRPLPGTTAQTDINIWVMDREGGHWGEPYPLSERINSKRVEFFPSVSRNGNLYFNRASADFSSSQVFRAELVDGDFADPKPLPDVINKGNKGSNVFVAADESFLLMPRLDSKGQHRLHVSFKLGDQNWTQPVALDSPFHPMASDDGARVSPDGRFILFSAAYYPTAGGIWGKPKALAQLEKLDMNSLQTFHRGPQNGSKDIYWISTDVMEALRPDTEN